MTAQDAVYRSERIGEHTQVKQMFLLHMLTSYLCDDTRYCRVVDEWLDGEDAAAVRLAAVVAAEMAAPPCVVCGGVAPGHSLTCPSGLSVAALTGELVTAP